MGPLRPKKEKEMKKKVSVADMVLLSAFTSIIIILAFVPQIGFITLPGVSLTTIHIPVLIGIMILKPRYALTLGIIFGLVSMSVSFMRATNPVDVAFQNPLVSVLPRALFGVIAWAIFYGFNQLSKLKFGSKLQFGIVAIITVLALYFGMIAFVEIVAPDLENSTMIGGSIGLLLAILMIIGYYIANLKRETDILSVPATMIIATLAHTALVLTALVVFGNLGHLFGDNIVGAIYGMVTVNGLLEALLAVFIGTPIYVALKRGNLLNQGK